MRKKRLILISLGILIAFIPIRKVFFGGFLNQIDLNFYFNINKIFLNSFFIWNEYNNGAFNIVHNILNTPMSSFSYFLDSMGVPLWLINKIWFLMPIFLLFISSFELSKTLITVDDNKFKKGIFWVSLIIALLVVISKNTIFAISFGWPIKYCLTLAGGFLMISNYIKFLTKGKYKYLVYSLLLSIISVSLIQNFVFSNIFIIVVSIYLCFKECSTRDVFKRYGIFLLGIFFINIWWIAPYIYATLSDFSYYTIDIMQQINNSSFNTFVRTLLIENSIPPKPYNEHYLESKVDIIYYFFLWASMFSIFLFRKIKKDLFIFLSILIFVYLFFAAGNVAPSGFLFVEMINRLPITTMFRTINKVDGFLLFTLIFGSIYSISKIFINSKLYEIKLKIYKKYVMGVFAVGLISIITVPGYFSGNLNGGLKSFSIPKEYHEFKINLDESKVNGNLLILPFPSWFSNFSWNEDINHIQNPVVSLVGSPVIYDEFHNTNLNIAQELFMNALLESNEYDDASESKINEFINYLKRMNIKYILIQHDNLNTFDSINSENPEVITKRLDNFLSKLKQKEIFKLEQRSNNMVVYRSNYSKTFLPFYISKKTIFIRGDIREKLSMEFKRENCNERWAVYFDERNNKFNNISQKEYDNSGNPIIEYTKINPTKYRVRVHSAEGVFPMVFSESFHEGWRAYVTQVESSKSKVQSNLEKYKILDGNEDDPKVINDGASPKVANGDGASQASVLDNYKILDGNEEDQASKSELEYFIKKGWVTSLGNLKERIIEHNKWEDNKEKLDYEEKYSIDFISKNFQDTIQNDNLPTGKFYETWLKKPLNADNHLMINGYANSWMIDVNEVCEKENVCVKNSDGSYDFEMVIEFWPQRLFYIGLGISGMTLFSCLVYLVYDWRKKRKLRANELK